MLGRHTYSFWVFCLYRPSWLSYVGFCTYGMQVCVYLYVCVSICGAIYDIDDKDDRVSDKPRVWYLVMDEV